LPASCWWLRLSRALRWRSGKQDPEKANLAGFKPTMLVPAIAPLWPTHDPVYTYDDGTTGLL
jgi:hypothetical protein